MADSPRSVGNAREPSKVGIAPSSGRRRILRAGISAAPVVMTVASRPVLGGPAFCQSPSATLSGNLSNPGAGGGICAGRTPGYWKNYQPGNSGGHTWPSGFYATDNYLGSPSTATKF